MGVVGAPFPLVGGHFCVVEKVCVFDREEFRIGCSGCSIFNGGWPCFVWLKECVGLNWRNFELDVVSAPFPLDGWPFVCY